MRVLKFGGSSLADAERFLRVSDIVVNNQQQVQVALVLSAPAKVTNLLVALVAQTSKGEDASATLAEIEGIFTRLITGLKARYANLADEFLTQRLQQELGTIRSKMQGIQLLNQCPDSVQALILSRGEALSIACMEQLMLARGEKVTLINPVEMLLAEGSFLESHVDIDASRARFAAQPVNEGHIYLMAGFTGGNAKGELVLLGRNGSDYSAAVLAACVNADCCEIWTDVDGVYSCDPRLVPDAVLLKRMSYKEAMELSYFGAKVLHPRTIAPIARFHIPCLIKNTFNPQGEGTLISADHGDDQYPVKGISDLSGISMINVSGPGMKGMVGMAGRMFTAVSRAGVSVVLITQASSEYSISFCIHTYDAEKALKVLNQEFELELKEKKASRDAIISFAENYSIKPQYINSGLEALGTTPLAHGCKLIELIPRPQITLENIAELVPAFRTELDKVPVSRKEEIIEAAEILIKYSGYIRREQIIADKINRLENIHIKGKFDYNAIQSLSTEARQKLTRIDPDTIAQASRIPGISPSDINILLVMLGR